MTRCVLPPCLLLAIAAGCDGRVYRMTIRADGSPAERVRERVIAAARDVAEAHGLSPVPPEQTADIRPQPLLAYRIEEPPEWGSEWVGLHVDRPKPSTFRVLVLTFPAFDYEIARRLRRELSTRVRDEVGDAAVRGF